MKPLNRIIASFAIVSAIGIPSSAAVAAPAVVNTVHFADTVFHPCVGEDLVTIEGQRHTVCKVEDEGFICNIHWFGKGTGSNGGEYVFSEHLHSFVDDINSIPPEAYEITEILIVGKGAAPNFWLLIQADVASDEVTIKTHCNGGEPDEP